MKQFKTLKELLDFIVEISKEDYREGFRNWKPEFDDDGHPMYEEEPVVIEYCNHECMFAGGMVPFCTMAGSYEYKGMYFRVGTSCSITGQLTTIAFAPNKDMLHDETWSIDIPMDVHLILYLFEDLK